MDFYLVKLATISGAVLLANYLCWALGALPLATSFLLIVLVIMMGCFFIRKPLDYLPIKLFMCALGFISLGSPTVGWDARTIWLFHAKRIFLDNDFYAQLDGYAGISHNDYPLLVPALSATLATCVGYWNEAFPKLASVLALIPAILLLSSVLQHKVQQLLLCALMLCVCADGLINGYMDGMLAMYFTAASLLIYVLTQPAEEQAFDREKRLWLYALTGIIFAGLTLIKNEGLIALMVLVMAIMCVRIVFPRTRITLAGGMVLLISVVPIVIWKILCAQSGIINDLTGSDLATQVMGRIFSLSAYVKIGEHLIVQTAFLLPLCVFILLCRMSNDISKTWFVMLAALGYFSIIFAVYLATPNDLDWHLATSADRTIFPLGLLLGFYAIVDAGNWLKKHRE